MEITKKKSEDLFKIYKMGFEIDEGFYHNTIRNFCFSIYRNNKDQVGFIDIGKSEDGSNYAITIYDKNSSELFREKFKNKWELIGFIQGALAEDGSTAGMI